MALMTAFHVLKGRVWRARLRLFVAWIAVNGVSVDGVSSPNPPPAGVLQTCFAVSGGHFPCDILQYESAQLLSRCHSAAWRPSGCPIVRFCSKIDFCH